MAASIWIRGTVVGCGMMCSAMAAAGAAESDARANAAAYRPAPEAVRKILDAPLPPSISVSPSREHLLVLTRASYPTIAELAQPMLGLAGLRINPKTWAPHRQQSIVGLTWRELNSGREAAVTLPPGARLSEPYWSPDSRWFAVTNTSPQGVELYLGTAATGELRRVPNLQVNLVYGDGLRWLPEGRGLVCQAVPPGRGAAPEPPDVPVGPTIEESVGRRGQVRTFQDLLKTPHDEKLLEYYATSQLTTVDPRNLQVEPLGTPGLMGTFDGSPDGEFLLVVRHERPFSYRHPITAFPKQIEIWDRSGKLVQRVASLPLADQVPIEGVPLGPRAVHWRPDQPATLLWVEALDGGDPKAKVPHRDRLLQLAAPFSSPPDERLLLEHRFAGLWWSDLNGLALVRDYDRDRRWERTLLAKFNEAQVSTEVIWSRSIQDRYGDPGNPLLRRTRSGHAVLWRDGQSIFLSGEGASPDGDRPFLDRFDWQTRRSERLFHCPPGSYEGVVALLTDDGKRVLTRRETPREPPNYWIRSGADAVPLTRYVDPNPEWQGIQKRLVTYPRKDGVQLSFTLYLPPGHQAGQPLPTLVWAYPREYNDSSTAGQVSGSPHRYTMLAGASHLFFLTQGYAVLDGAAMPVVGDPETANDTFVEQIVASAQAAIDKAVELGVTDRHRVGVAGHSYGAFMTANLLAHSDLFRAGIARSGAYNRTLTPFGFQSERRTLWEASPIYQRVSPFMFAHQITEPILLIHGAADDNAGTFPVQSERLYQAIAGNGGHVRYVSLPHESHGYAARESIEHALAEMIDWFDRHVKGAAPR